jgi:photosystem II stability/assembly factor-like uncharacterized protein
MRIKLQWLAGAFAVAAAVLQGAANAQDVVPATMQPHPSEIMPKAAQALMLSVTAAGDHLVAVGSRGQVLLSNDGSNWTQVETPVRSALTAVTFVSADEGWAVGHDATILHTTDGGKTWTLQGYDPQLQKPLLSVLFTDRNDGIAIGAFGLYETTADGGLHWTRLDPGKDDPAILQDALHLYSIRRLGSGALFIAGEQGTVALSTDNGTTWSKLPSPYDGTFFGAVPVGEHGVLVCGLRGNAYMAPNADTPTPTWQKLDTGTTDSLFGCAAAGDDRVAMVGLNGTLLLADTRNGTVTRADSGVDSTLSGVAAWHSGLVVVGEPGVHDVSLNSVSLNK